MYIRLPVRIITPKQPNRTNSLFYSGKDIALFKILNRRYVLTAAGDYQFVINKKVYNEKSPIVQRLKNHTLKAWERSGKLEVTTWGWFGINIWIDKEFQSYPTDIYTTYDEALKAFKNFILKDLEENNG